MFLFVIDKGPNNLMNGESKNDFFISCHVNLLQRCETSNPICGTKFLSGMRTLVIIFSLAFSSIVCPLIFYFIFPHLYLFSQFQELILELSLIDLQHH